MVGTAIAFSKPLCLLNTTQVVLLVEILKPHLLHEASILLRLSWMAFIVLLIVLFVPDLYIAQSSANRDFSIFSNSPGRSFIAMRNSKGLSGLPWGVPFSGDLTAESAFPKRTWNVLLCRK